MLTAARRLTGSPCWRLTLIFNLLWFYFVYFWGSALPRFTYYILFYLCFLYFLNGFAINFDCFCTFCLIFHIISLLIWYTKHQKWTCGTVKDCACFFYDKFVWNAFQPTQTHPRTDSHSYLELFMCKSSTKLYT